MGSQSWVPTGISQTRQGAGDVFAKKDDGRSSAWVRHGLHEPALHIKSQACSHRGPRIGALPKQFLCISV